MDSKRAAPETGDGPDPKRVDTTEDQDKLEEHGSPVSLEATHFAPYTGNGFTASLESLMFQPTLAGSQLISWCRNFENDLELEKSAIGEKKQSSPGKTSRREQAKSRREDTMKALAVERELTIKPGQNTASVVLIVRFPDPEITVSMLTDVSKEIRDVVMPYSVAPRYCLVYLKSGANVEATIADINKVRFGTGFLQAEHKHFSDEEQADFIDPCSLYVSNIPFNMTTSAIKACFVHALRVDIGVLKREKRARYAFVRYASPEAAITAFRDLVSCPLNGRTLTVRFRRLRKRSGMPIVQCTSSIVTMTQPSSGAGGDDDNVDCKVISPPPVESITISDSDNCSDSSNDDKEHKSKTSEQEEIQKLKRQMAHYGAILKSFQNRQNFLGDTLSSALVPKPEPCPIPSAYIPVLGSHAVHVMRDIKTEREYLGIPDEAGPEPNPAVKPTTQTPPENITEKEDQQKIKKPHCFGWLFSGFTRRGQSAKETADKTKASKASPNKDDRLEELYAQLEADSDP
ncbi:protein painting of fourth isoform X2 [Drosophila kikkawai]|uniref:Protein painting of fourth isoform X2 n=1 Tax=Drosophila kikkawai TaxID=30033 RepID=A0A6P4IP28_DROKI|nr:protein painting of fourth isoform X2 [Drosophila kikkawai]